MNANEREGEEGGHGYSPAPTPDTCPRIAGQAPHGAPCFRPRYGEAVYSIRDEDLGQLTRTGLCAVCGAATYKDYSGMLWHATLDGYVPLGPVKDLLADGRGGSALKRRG